MKLTKKVLAVLLAALMVVVAAFAGCSASKSNDDSKEPSSTDAKTVKFGLITLHDENSTYDKNFISAAQEAAEACGVELVQKNNIEEGQAAYEAAAELVDEGCNLILADSFGHEDYIIQAAKEFTDVQFLQQVQRLTQRTFQITTTLSLLSMRADTLQVLQQVKSSTK